MDVEIATPSGQGVMERFLSTCCRSLGLLALVLLTGGFSLAHAQTWEGSGPYPAGAESRTVHAIKVDPATGRWYAGTGSGTVFVLRFPGMGEPPVAVDDFAVTNPGVAILIDVVANDVDPEGALWNSNIEGNQGQHGTVTYTLIGPDHAGLTYTPDDGFVGTDIFDYDVADHARNVSANALVTVRVNAPPAAGDDAASVLQNESVTIDVLANDSDADGSLDPATVAVSDPPANGSALDEADGRITYAPAVDFIGSDSFTYTVGDDDGGVSSAATVTITVSAAPNTPPVALDDVASTVEGSPVTIVVLANDGDADGTLNPATVTVRTEPGEGSVVVNADGSIAYTPGAGFSGTDMFTYTVADDTGETSEVATVTVTVNATGNPPAPPTSGGGGGGGGAAGLPLLLVMAFAFLRRAVADRIRAPRTPPIPRRRTAPRGSPRRRGRVSCLRAP